MREIHNGGITLTIGSYVLRIVKEYQHSFANEGDSFENWDFTTVTNDKGTRFSCLVETVLPAAEKERLISALSARTFNFVCPDYTGVVRLTAPVSASIVSANHLGTYYKISFSVAAVTLDGASGGL